MILTVEPGATPATLCPKGEVDMATAPLLREALEQAQRTGEQLVVDMAGITFIDSAGLHVLITTSLSLEQPLVLTNVPSNVERILEIVRLDQVPSIEIR